MTAINKVSILGGAGFLGTRLSQRFYNKEQNHEICDLEVGEASKNLTIVDIEDLNSLNRVDGSDCIINLAAVHRDDIRPLSRYDDVNIQGSVNVCEAARKNGINKVIFTSSVAIYGFAPADTDESGEPNYFNDYG